MLVDSKWRQVKNTDFVSRYSIASPLGCVDEPGGSIMHYGFQQGENLGTSEIHGTNDWERPAV